MNKFVTHCGIAAPLMRDNIDTDQIMPKQFLKRVERSGFGAFIFYDWRFDENGESIAGFELNIPRYENASILITGKNFGCGSSREHAPWGLYDYGFKVIIADSFADIFYNNCFKTGILPVTVPNYERNYLADRCVSNPGYKIAANLAGQIISDDYGFEFHFNIEPFRKYCLSEGLDDIGLTERFETDISSYENSRSNWPS